MSEENKHTGSAFETLMSREEAKANIDKDAKELLAQAQRRLDNFKRETRTYAGSLSKNELERKYVDLCIVVAELQHDNDTLNKFVEDLAKMNDKTIVAGTNDPVQETKND